MAKVIGLGGVFFRSKNPAELRAWYGEHLGMPITDYGVSFLPAAVPKGGYHVWSPFEKDSEYLGGPDQSYMINLMVDDLAGCLQAVTKAGAKGVRGPDVSEYGAFGWFEDPEGNRIELWQPATGLPEDVK
ncbi:MAG: putative enzyme related to lactoylglutathione lyase [Planctomycetota bacterium]|jgi:predicted enzyme related to lactoylglutathione lyase